MYLTRVIGEQEIKCEKIFVTVCLGWRERWRKKRKKICCSRKVFVKYLYD